MSVHSTHYDDQDEYERDLAWEYRTEGRVRNHKRKDIPFYDEPEEYEAEDEDDQVIDNHTLL